MFKGRCECGNVTFEVDGDITDFSHCHCSQCRRLHGAAYATFAGVKNEDFRYTRSGDSLGSYASSASHKRLFCSNCGSNIGVQLTDEPDMLYLSMGAVDGDPPRPDAYHIFVGSKAPWHTILDTAPQFEEFEPEE